MTRLKAAAVLIGVVLSSAGCASRTSVGRVLREPTRYQNRDITVEGRVTSSVNALIAGGYRVDDGTGTITVISNGGPPRKGDAVKVRGRVQSGVSVLGQSFGTTLREHEREVKTR